MVNNWTADWTSSIRWFNLVKLQFNLSSPITLTYCLLTLTVLTDSFMFCLESACEDRESQGMTPLRLLNVPQTFQIPHTPGKGIFPWAINSFCCDISIISWYTIEIERKLVKWLSLIFQLVSVKERGLSLNLYPGKIVLVRAKWKVSISLDFFFLHLSLHFPLNIICIWR